MWWRAKPQTASERDEEIARLERVRDKMLDRAPRSFAFQQVIAPIMFAAYLLVFGGTLLLHREQVNFYFVVAASGGCDFRKSTTLAMGPSVARPRDTEIGKTPA